MQFQQRMCKCVQCLKYIECLHSPSIGIGFHWNKALELLSVNNYNIKRICCTRCTTVHHGCLQFPWKFNNQHITYGNHVIAKQSFGMFQQNCQHECFHRSLVSIKGVLCITRRFINSTSKDTVDTTSNVGRDREGERRGETSKRNLLKTLHD